MAKRRQVIATFQIKLLVPKGVTLDRLQAYIKRAVQCDKGGLDPQDPLTDLMPDNVTCSLVKQEITYA